MPLYSINNDGDIATAAAAVNDDDDNPDDKPEKYLCHSDQVTCEVKE